MANNLDWRFNPFDPQGKLLAEIISADDTNNTTFGEADVAEVIQLATSGNQFDGMAVAILRLRDGRIAAFDTPYASYAGNDFTDGHGKVFVAISIEPLISRLSVYGQRLMRETIVRNPS